MASMSAARRSARLTVTWSLAIAAPPVAFAVGVIPVDDGVNRIPSAGVHAQERGVRRAGRAGRGHDRGEAGLAEDSGSRAAGMGRGVDQADTYTSLFADEGHAVAEQVASVVPRAVAVGEASETPGPSSVPAGRPKVIRPIK
jgi:hypothetical protein